MNCYEAIAKILKQEGVECLFCFLNNPIIEAAAQEGIRPVMFRHERGAVMAADGYSRTSGRRRFGVVAVQSQPGAENAMGGVAQAFADNIPILVLPDGVALGRTAVRPSFSAVRNYQGIVTRGEAITCGDQVAGVMRRAFHALRNGRPGPVLVEMTSDVCAKEVPEDLPEYVAPCALLQTPAPGHIKDAAKALLDAGKPVIWAGGGVLMSGAAAELKELAELAEIPVVCTMQGKSAFDERHPLSLGVGGRTTTLPARKWLQEADVVFAVGASLTKTLFGQPIPQEKIIIQNTNAMEDINKDAVVDIGLPGDARLTLQAMLEEVKLQIGEKGRRGQTDVADRIADLRARWLAQWKSVLNSDEQPINTYRVIGDIGRTLDLENSIVTHDAGSPRDTLLPFYPATVPHSYVGWGKTTHLGFGLPLMIGAKLAHPDKFCLNFMGDAAFGMSGMDLETAARAQVPITTVLLNNGGMATYPGGFPTARERFGLTLMQGDYAKIAEGMGAVGITVTKPDEIVPALQKAQKLNADGKTVLIDMHSNFESRRSLKPE